MNVDRCKFLRLADAIACVGQRVNLVGLAVETSIPKSTKGSDCFCSVRIIDESLPNGIRVHFFAKTMENLPLMEYAGDILLVSQVWIKTWKDEVFAQFDKKYSSFALFDEGIGSSTDELVPYQISPRYNPRYHCRNLVNFVTRLMKWSPVDKIEALHALNEPLLLKKIKEGEHQNLLCKILHVAEVNDDEWMLYIWDGTDAPPVSVEAKLEDEMKNPLPLVLEPSPLSRDILCTFPTVGTVLRMTVDQDLEKKLGIEFVKANRWVKFIDVRCEAHVALWRAVLTPFSKLCYLRDNDSRVVRRQRSHENKLEMMPFTSLSWPSHLTETDHPDLPILTLMDILTFPEVTHTFKCVARVVAILPWRAVDFHSPSGILRVRVTLEDPTARIHAYLYKEDGVKFFGSCQSVDELTRKRNLLLGVAGEDGSRNPPWIQCCLKSYYVKKDDIWGSRNYRIFQTTFVG